MIAVRNLRRYERPVFVGLLALSVCANIALAYRRARPTPPEPSRLAKGMKAPELMVETVDGSKHRSIDFRAPEKGTIVYFVDASCPWCERNLAALKALATYASPRYRLVAVARRTSRLPQLQDRMPANIEVLVASSKTASAYKFDGLPQTVVVDSQGIVVANWTGAYTGTVRGDVETLFGLRLPDLGSN